jgi:hypothetical protein
MPGSIKQARKGLRPQVQGKTQSQPVTQHEGSGSKPKPMTSGTAKPASTWFK